MKKLLLIMLSCMLLLTACGTKTKTTAGTGEGEQAAVTPQEEPEKNTEIYATIDVKDYGTIELVLYPDIAPETVENFVNLAESGFYDGLTFHRIMTGFMIQGGDPMGNGTGGSGNSIKGEFAANGFDNPLLHDRGVISMARAKDPNSASSQFFIVHEDSERNHMSLDGLYASFGKVVSGMEVVDAICETVVPLDDNGTVPADQQPVINSITIKK